MPIGKKIHEVLSKKFKARKQRALDATKNGPVEPPTVDQFRKNKVARASSVNVHIVDLAGGPRQISPNEGMPAVNSKSGPELVKKAVSKVKSADTKAFDGAGAIEQAVKREKKCSSCKKPGHTKRNCPN